MSTPLQELLSILDLETLEDNLFRGRNMATTWGRVFGGQVVAQALTAAARTVVGLPVHSLHGYFLLGGDPAAPIVFEVERVRDGRSFTTRRAVAIQHGRPIFVMSASFHQPEAGYDHQMALPEGIPDPETLTDAATLAGQPWPGLAEGMRRYWARPRPIELRPTDLGRYRGVPQARPGQNTWFRAAGPLPDDPAIHRAVLAYASDIMLLDTALVVHDTSVLSDTLQAASLDHAVWFHRPFRADDWLLYAQDSPSAFGGRGMTRGMVFTRDGTLVASMAQEGLIRPVQPRRAE